jgi:hypothetical protein
MPRKKMVASNPRSRETYPLKLTKLQRDSLIHCTRISNRIKERLKAAGEGTQIVGVTRKELDHINDEIGDAAVYVPSPHKKRLVSVLHQVAELFAEERANRFGDEVSKFRKTAPIKDSLMHQFRVTLLDIKPAIWRRFQIHDCTLAILHQHIQAAFGWWNYHLHQFLIDGKRYGLPDPEDFDIVDPMVDESAVLLSNLIPKSGRRSRWIYEYDFGDGWRHEVLFEGFPPTDPKAQYPLCLEGERACPPEDCGGVGGYAEYLAAITDPRDEEHNVMLEWRGPFDPEAFDTKKATTEMRKVK